MSFRYKAPRVDETVEKLDRMIEEERKVFLDFVRASRKNAMSFGRGHTVLYIDSNPDSQSFLKSLLEHACNQLESERLGLLVSSNIEHAKRKVKSHYYDLKIIIIDASFNGENSDGMNFLRWLSEEFSSMLPVLVLTSDAESGSQLPGAFDNVEVLFKPAPKDKILEAIFHDTVKDE